MFLNFRDVTFAYESSAEPLFERLTLSLPAGWTGVVGPNGSGKTTFMRLACRHLTPVSGSLQVPPSTVYCAQRTDDPPEVLSGLLESSDPLALRLCRRLGLRETWHRDWAHLSHGERKRAQIAAALWQEPDVLALDEPTNHIDQSAARTLADALASFKRIGILVSHDRELLDRLCSSCLVLGRGDPVFRPGGYTRAIEQLQIEEESTRREHEQARRRLERLRGEAQSRREEADRAAGKRRGKGIAPGDKDARGKIHLAVFTGKDGAAGRRLTQLDGRLRYAQDEMDKTGVTKEHRRGIWLPGSRSRRNALLELPPGSIPLGDGRTLQHPSLSVMPSARIAITGDNGTGKSTLVRHIIEKLLIPAGRVLYVPQEVDLEQTRLIMGQVENLGDEEMGAVMTVVRRLGSDPVHLLGNPVASPGEIRKILLALGMQSSPYLVVMDEPTNHLDLPAIESLEQALDECPGALMVVSHDRVFLRHLAKTEWHIGAACSAGPDTMLRILNEPA